MPGIWSIAFWPIIGLSLTVLGFMSHLVKFHTRTSECMDLRMVSPERNSLYPHLSDVVRLKCDSTYITVMQLEYNNGRPHDYRKERGYSSKQVYQKVKRDRTGNRCLGYEYISAVVDFRKALIS